MKRILVFILFLGVFTHAIAQKSFQGHVVYSISIISKNQTISSERLNSLMGNTMDYYIKGANYKSKFNGTASEWQMYLNKDNKIYNKTRAKNYILWKDVAINHDTIYKTVLKKNDTTILGYKCDKLILTCNSGKQIYYFNSSLAINPDIYIQHQEGNWYAFLKISKSIALKEIMERKSMIFTITATSVRKEELDDKIFKLPKDAPLVEMTVDL